MTTMMLKSGAGHAGPSPQTALGPHPGSLLGAPTTKRRAPKLDDVLVELNKSREASVVRPLDEESQARFDEGTRKVADFTSRVMEIEERLSRPGPQFNCVGKALAKCGFDWVDAPPVVSLEALTRLSAVAGASIMLVYQTRTTANPLVLRQHLLAGVDNQHGDGVLILHVNRNLTHCSKALVAGPPRLRGVFDSSSPPVVRAGPTIGSVVSAYTNVSNEVRLATQTEAKPKKGKGKGGRQGDRPPRQRKPRQPLPPPVTNMTKLAEELGQSPEEIRQTYAALIGELRSTLKDRADGTRGPNAPNPEKLAARLRTLENQILKTPEGPFAANFGRGATARAASFGMGTAPAIQLSNNAQEMIANVIAGHTHPPRFMDSTKVQKVESASTVTPGSMSGEQLIILSPLESSYKGGIILKRNVATPTSWTFVDYFSPVLDVDSVTVASAVLYSALTVSSVQVGGGSTVLASNALVESGVLPFSPMAVATGKMKALAGEARATDVVPLTKEGAAVLDFTFDQTDEELVRRDLSSAASGDIAIAPRAGTYTSAAVSTLRAGGGHLSIVASNSGAAGANLLAGWQAALSPEVSGGAFPVANTSLWKATDNADFLRWMVWGRCVVEVSLPLDCQTNATAILVHVIVTYWDGSSNTLSRSVCQYLPAISGCISFEKTFDFAQGSDAAGKAALFIKDVEVQVEVQSADTDTVTWSTDSAYRCPLVSAHFLDVSPTTQYLAHTITGLSDDHTVSVAMRSDVEMFVSHAALSAGFIEPEHLAPFDREALLLHYEHAGRPAVPSAKSFGYYMRKGAKKVGKFIANAGREVGETALEVAPALAGGALMASMGLPGAANFGEGRSSQQEGFNFPVIFEDRSTASVHIVPGSSAKTPSFVHDITTKELRPSTTAYQGSSDGLAFLMAALHADGWRVRPGLYSAEVRNVEYSGDSIAFDILPIRGAPDKSANETFTHEFVLGPRGVYGPYGEAPRPPARTDFYAGRGVSFRSAPFEATGVPGTSYHIVMTDGPPAVPVNPHARIIGAEATSY